MWYRAAAVRPARAEHCAEIAFAGTAVGARRARRTVGGGRSAVGMVYARPR